MVFQLKRSPLLRHGKAILADYGGLYVSTQAAALSYYALFSIVPLSFFLVLVVTRVFGQAIVEGDFFGQMVGFLGPEAAEQLQNFAAIGASQNAGILSWIVTLSLLWWTASGLFVQLKFSLNRIWAKDYSEKAGMLNYLWQRAWASLAMAVIGGVFMVASLLGVVAISLVETFWIDHALAELLPALRLLELGISGLALFGVFLVLYRFLPTGFALWRVAVMSSTLAMVLVMLAKYAVGIYLDMTDFGSPFGAAGSVVVLVFWFYLMAQIFLVSALVGKYLYGEGVVQESGE